MVPQAQCAEIVRARRPAVLEGRRVVGLALVGRLVAARTSTDTVAGCDVRALGIRELVAAYAEIERMAISAVHDDTAHCHQFGIGEDGTRG